MKKPWGSLLRVLISPPPRVRIAKVDLDASLLRLETPATRPLLGAGDCAWSGRGECGRPPDGRWRTHARRNVPAPPGLLARESRRDLDCPECDGCESIARGPVRVERARPHAGAARGPGRIVEPVRCSGRLSVGPRERFGPTGRSRRHGCAGAARSERDPR